MNKRGVILSVFVLLAVAASAQKPVADTALRQATIEVIQAYKPEVKTMSRPELQPQMPLADTSRPVFTYIVPQQTLYYTYRSLPLRPLMLSTDTVRAPFPGYLKLGGGNLSTFYAEGGTALSVNKDLNTVLHLSHINQEGSLKNQKTSLSSLNATGSYRSAGYLWEGGISALRNSYYTYGFNHDAYSYTASDLRNTYVSGLLSLSAQKLSVTRSGITYKPYITTGIYTDGKENSEPSFNAAINASKTIDSNLKAGLAADSRFAWYKSPGSSVGNHVFALTPYVEYTQGALGTRLGLTGALGMNGTAYLLPDLFLSYGLAPSSLLLSAGWKGDIKQNTFRELTTLNPYLNKQYITAQTRRDEIYGSAAMSLGNHISFGVRLGYWSFTNLPLFLNDTGTTRDFYIVYDNKVGALSLQPYVRYEIGTLFSASLSGAFYNFTRHSYNRLWHIPTTEVKLSIDYKPMKDLSVKAYLVMLDGIYGRNIIGQEVRLSAVVDAGGGVEYHFIPRLIGFANITNTFNAHNQRWMGYDAYGLGIFGGLRLSF